MRSPLALFIVAPLACATGACGDNAASPPGEAVDEPAILRERVFVADEVLTREAEVNKDRIVVRASGHDDLLALREGDVMSSGRADVSSKNPDGFLRKVTRSAQEGDSVVVYTTDARLTDAILQGHLRAGTGGVVLYDGPSSSSTWPADLGSSRATRVDVKDKTLWSGEDAGLAGTARLVRATLAATPAMELDVRIHEARVSRFVAIVEGAFDAAVEIELDARGSRWEGAQTTGHHASVPLYRSDVLRLPDRLLGTMRVSPQVVFTVSVECDVRFEGAVHARPALAVKGSLRVGAEYDGTGWRPVVPDLDVTPSVEVEVPGPLDAKCAIVTEATMSANSLGGVTLRYAPRFALDMHSEATAWTYALTAGADARVVGEAELLGATVDRQIFDWTSPHGVARRRVRPRTQFLVSTP